MKCEAPKLFSLKCAWGFFLLSFSHGNRHEGTNTNKQIEIRIIISQKHLAVADTVSCLETHQNLDLTPGEQNSRAQRQRHI